MEEENKINEAQVSLISSEGESGKAGNFEAEKENTGEKKRKDFHIELVLFLILGILMGIAVKNEAVKKVTMGYDDYRMKIMTTDYDINKLQADLIRVSMENAAQELDESSQEEVDLQDNNQNNN